MGIWLLLVDTVVRFINFASLTENGCNLLKSLHERPRHPVINICMREV